MPRLGVPSTTDSAPRARDAYGEPAPCRGRHNPRTTSTSRHFPRDYQPRIESWEKGRKEGVSSPARGANARPQARLARLRLQARPRTRRERMARGDGEEAFVFKSFAPTAATAGVAS